MTIYAIMNPVQFGTTIYVYDECNVKQAMTTVPYRDFYRTLFAYTEEYDISDIVLDGSTETYLEGIKKTISSMCISKYNKEDKFNIVIYKEKE